MRLSRTLASLCGAFNFVNGDTQFCQDPSIETCRDCILRGPDCAWCADNITASDMGTHRMKCGRLDDLKLQGCKQIEADAKSSLKVTESGKKIRPKKSTVELRHGESYSFQIEFHSEEYYPIDMYYVMDLSQSMQDDLFKLKDLASKLSEKMVEITGKDNFRIGHGSFVDKPVMPFISTTEEDLKNPCSKDKPCEPAYNFHNNLNLTLDTSKFFEIVDKMDHSSNLDQAEAGLDGILQAAVCKDLIGWGDDRHKLIVYSSDAPFHVAGDGKLGGILEPNDMKCHTDGSVLPNEIPREKAIQFDYPSIGQIVDVISKNEIIMIFAVTKGVKKTYSLLADLLPLAAVGELEDDSNNVINIIEEKYNQLAQKVRLQHSGIPENVQVAAKVKCHADREVWIDGFECEQINRNQAVTYNVTLTWNSDGICPDISAAKADFLIYGMDAKSEVEIKFICDCDCPVYPAPSFIVDPKFTLDKISVPFSCNSGNYSCGQCVCPDGQTGNMCECDVETDTANVWEGCMDPNSADKKPCSGFGSCVCGKCQCQKYLGRDITGNFCECDSDECHKFNNLPCGGPEHGTCQCDGTCKCADGWSGDNCSCSTDKRVCKNPQDLKRLGDSAAECSGNGDCNCGKCECKHFPGIGKYTGRYCENFNSKCEQHEDCAKCLANAFFDDENTGILGKKCVESCRSVDQETNKRTDFYIEGLVEADSDGLFKIENGQDIFISKDDNADALNCVSKDREGCQFNFGYKMSEAKKVNMMISDTRACPEPVNVWMVVGGILGGVVFLGLIILLLIKLIICWISRMEVKEFENMRSKEALTSGNNPIYQKPETTHRTDNIVYRGAALRS